MRRVGFVRVRFFMSKILLRIAAIFLVPCLLADPFRPVDPSRPFQTQALGPRPFSIPERFSDRLDNLYEPAVVVYQSLNSPQFSPEFSEEGLSRDAQVTTESPPAPLRIAASVMQAIMADLEKANSDDRRRAPDGKRLEIAGYVSRSHEQSVVFDHLHERIDAQDLVRIEAQIKHVENLKGVQKQAVQRLVDIYNDLVQQRSTLIATFNAMVESKSDAFNMLIDRYNNLIRTNPRSGEIHILNHQIESEREVIGSLSEEVLLLNGEPSRLTKARSREGHALQTVDSEIAQLSARIRVHDKRLAEMKVEHGQWQDKKADKVVIYENQTDYVKSAMLGRRGDHDLSYHNHEVMVAYPRIEVWFQWFVQRILGRAKGWGKVINYKNYYGAGHNPKQGLDSLLSAFCPSRMDIDSLEKSGEESAMIVVHFASFYIPYGYRIVRKNKPTSYAGNNYQHAWEFVPVRVEGALTEKSYIAVNLSGQPSPAQGPIDVAQQVLELFLATHGFSGQNLRGSFLRWYFLHFLFERTTEVFLDVEAMHHDNQAKDRGTRFDDSERWMISEAEEERPEPAPAAKIPAEAETTSKKTPSPIVFISDNANYTGTQKTIPPDIAPEETPLNSPLPVEPERPVPMRVARAPSLSFFGGTLTLGLLLAHMTMVVLTTKADVIRVGTFVVGGWALLLGLMVAACAVLNITLDAGKATRILGWAAIPIVLRAAGILSGCLPNVMVLPSPVLWLRPLDLFEMASAVTLGISLYRQPEATLIKSLAAAVLIALGWTLAAHGYFHPF